MTVNVHVIEACTFSFSCSFQKLQNFSEPLVVMGGTESRVL